MWLYQKFETQFGSLCLCLYLVLGPPPILCSSISSIFFTLLPSNLIRLEFILPVSQNLFLLKGEDTLICTFLFPLFCYRKIFFLFRPHPWHMEVPRPSTESKPELQPMSQLQQCQILNPLCWTGDQTSASRDKLCQQQLILI